MQHQLMQMQQQQQQQQQPMVMTTDHIQQYLDENKWLILKILENQNSGKLSENAENQARLQQNLTYPATIADCQPQMSFVFDQYLDENKWLILKILENQNSGKLSERAENQAKLQQNLMHLAAIADCQPQTSFMFDQVKLFGQKWVNITEYPSAQLQEEWNIPYFLEVLSSISLPKSMK